jgi:cbb3-type cytochrome oxidase maturation protein
MEIVYLLLPLALLLSGTGLALFFWAVRQNQFEDLEGPAWRILEEDR